MDEKTIIPESLTFDFIPECKNCGYLDLTTKSWDLFYDNKGGVKDYVLSCSHLKSCKAMAERCHDHK